jgi:hypothetical protein
MTQNENGRHAPPDKAREVTEIRGFLMQNDKERLVARCLDRAPITGKPEVDFPIADDSGSDGDKRVYRD